MATAGPALDDKALPADAGPGARGRRRALRLLALSYLLSFGGIGLQVPLLSPSLAKLGLGAAVIGGLWAVRSATGIVAPALLGLLADRLRADRALASLCLLGAGASLMGLVFIDGELGATISFAAYGLFGTASVSLVDGMVLTALGPQRGRYGRVRMWGAVGFGVVALVATQLDDGLLAAPAVVFVSAGLLAALAALAVAMAGRLPRAGGQPLVDVLGDLLRARVGVLAVLAVFHWASHGAYTAFITPLAEASGHDTRLVGIALAISIVVEIVALQTADRAQEILGERRLLIVVTSVACLRWLGLSFATSAAAFIALHALHGITFGWFYPTVVTLLASRVPERARQGAQGAFTSGTFGIGGALGMALAGASLEQSGHASEVWRVMAWLAAASVLAALALRRRR
jgi:PPP family 3-phenylpropionic acid transporter